MQKSTIRQENIYALSMRKLYNGKIGLKIKLDRLLLLYFCLNKIKYTG
jgi:hypothetical protein